MRREALLTLDRRYRYWLRRDWGERPGATPPVVWVMLNPSTADADVDDPTIRRCIGFARGWGYEAIEVVNLYAWRATNPRDLRLAADRGVDLIGPDNLAAIREAIDAAGIVVAAWGASARTHCATLPRPDVEQIADDARRRLTCLGLTKGGDPRHPLYVPAAVELVGWGGYDTPDTKDPNR